MKIFCSNGLKILLIKIRVEIVEQYIEVRQATTYVPRDLTTRITGVAFFIFYSLGCCNVFQDVLHGRDFYIWVSLVSCHCVWRATGNIRWERCVQRLPSTTV